MHTEVDLKLCFSLRTSRAQYIDILSWFNVVLASDVIETATFETETEIWLKLRDRDFIKNSETRDLKFETQTDTQDLKICGFFWKFQKTIVITSKLKVFQIYGVCQTCFCCFSPANTTKKNFLNYSSFTKPFLCDIQSLKTIGCDWNM